MVTLGKGCPALTPFPTRGPPGWDAGGIRSPSPVRGWPALQLRLPGGGGRGHMTPVWPLGPAHEGQAWLPARHGEDHLGPRARSGLRQPGRGRESCEDGAEWGHLLFPSFPPLTGPSVMFFSRQPRWTAVARSQGPRTPESDVCPRAPKPAGLRHLPSEPLAWSCFVDALKGAVVPVSWLLRVSGTTWGGAWSRRLGRWATRS